MSAGRIDVHSHFLPDGFPPLPEWDALQHVAVLDQLDADLTANSHRLFSTLARD